MGQDDPGLSVYAGRSFHETMRRSRSDFSASSEILIASLPTCPFTSGLAPVRMLLAKARYSR